jgi:SAM-dependent methyltransferase
MQTTIDTSVLKQISAHHRRLGVKNWLKGLPYERCAELSWIIRHLEPQFRKPLRYLDIGTGESPLPTFLYAHSRWDITCLDKCPWVRKQNRFLKTVDTDQAAAARRFRIVEQDLLKANLPDESFDVITSVSVIEHFEGASDSAAMKACARLLRPGGSLVLTTLVNDSFFAEFYLKKPVYGEEFAGSPVFYQRHYDLKSVWERIVKPSGLVEKERVYFGDYGFQCFEKVLQWKKPLRALYAWSTPWLASRYLSYRPYPISRKDMRMNTASGVIVVLSNPN